MTDHSNLDPLPVSAPVQPTRSGWKEAVTFIKQFLKVFLVFYIFTHVLFQQYQVEGASMAPNLHTNDRLWVDRVSYVFHQPSRGDIVVLLYPKDISTHFVKRVIALPGERVRIQNGQVTIFNVQHVNGFVLQEPYLAPGTPTLSAAGNEANEFVVPQNSYFVMGDNRPASSDSRMWGFLPTQDVVGKVVLRSFPFAQFSFFSTPDYQS